MREAVARPRAARPPPPRRGSSTPTPEEEAAIQAALQARGVTTGAARGGRGRGRRAAPVTEAAEAPALESATREAEVTAAPTEERPRAERDQSRRRRGHRDDAPARAPRAEPAPTRDGQRGGSAEALIARQNVLFEEFVGRQQQTLRDIQRSLQNSGRGGRAASGAVAPIVLPKVGVFLDVPNLMYAAEDLGVRIDFGKLLDYLTEGRQLVRATAYAPVTDDPMTRFENQRFVHPVLGHGYKVVTKTWKRFADGGMKANFDIELAVDILTMSDRLDIVVLLSGDGDFKRVIELVESKGVRVEVCAFAQSTANELRAVADQYIELGSILQQVGA